ncbi:MAG: hypothetical protein FJ026_08755, partial [Chloroflexi bacterium]|nr:hypothetical protein [Chloroflexota bacterium]
MKLQRVVFHRREEGPVTEEEVLRAAIFELGPSEGERAFAYSQPLEVPPPPRPPPGTLPTHLGRLLGLPIVLKFVEGSRVRLRDGLLTVDLGTLTPNDHALLARGGIGPDDLPPELEEINHLIADARGVEIRRAFSAEEELLEAEKAEAEEASDEEMADLNLYYVAWVEGSDAAVAQAIELTEALNHFRAVETAYPSPRPVPAQTPSGAATPTRADLAAGQGYLNPAPTGIDARRARHFGGGDGSRIRFVDIETAWTLDHEDLPALWWNDAHLNIGDANHGTASVGIVAARGGSFGVTGITPAAQVGVYALYRGTWSTADAINASARKLRSGDAILIEVHFPGPTSRWWEDVVHNQQRGFVPVEYESAEYDAIRLATGRGILIIEPAGNGAVNLDAALYAGRFDRSKRDSRAIMVGAGTANGRRVPESFTNYGGRVDVHGWGDSVVTLGYGHVRYAGGDARQWYTQSFGGTSSASPIVTGAAVAINSILRRYGKGTKSPAGMRTLLRSTGTPQADPGKQIGPMPDLAAALRAAGVAAQEAVWDAKWNEGWTHFVPFVLQSQPHYLAYKAQDGHVDIDRIKADGRGVDSVWTGTFPSSYTTFAPFVLRGRPHFLAYRLGSGQIHINRIKDDGKGYITCWSGTFPPGLTSLVVFQFHGEAHYLMSNATTGGLAIGRIKRDGTGVEPFWNGPVTTGLTAFLPFVLDGWPHFLAYLPSGSIFLLRLKADGHGLDVAGYAQCEAGCTQFMGLAVKGRPHFLAYNTTSGEFALGRIQAGASGVDTLWEGKWTAGWTTFMPFCQEHPTRLLTYNQANGQVVMSQIALDGRGLTPVWQGGWSTGWTSITPFELQGKPYAHFYKAGSGEAAIHGMRADGRGIIHVKSGQRESGWTSFMPFALDGVPHYLAFKAGKGDVAIHHIEQCTLAETTRLTGKWAPEWTQFMPFPLGAASCFLAYQSASGKFRLYRFWANGGGVDTLYDGTRSAGRTHLTP